MSSTPKPVRRKGDALKPRKKLTVINVMGDKKLTPRQIFEVRKVVALAYAKALQHYDDRNEDTYRQEECIKAVSVRLSQARNSHFELLMAHFWREAGNLKQALDWEIRADPERVAIRRFRHLIIAWIKGHTEATEDEAAFAYVNKICQDCWNLPADRASSEQLQYVFLRLKSPTKKQFAAPSEEETEEPEEPRFNSLLMDLERTPEPEPVITPF